MGKCDYLFWSKLWAIVWDKCWRNAVCGEDCLQGPERFAPMWYSPCSALHQVVWEVISHEDVHLPMEVEKVAGDFVPWATWKLWCNHGLSLSAGRVIILHKLFDFFTWHLEPPHCRCDLQEASPWWPLYIIYRASLRSSRLLQRVSSPLTCQCGSMLCGICSFLGPAILADCDEIYKYEQMPSWRWASQYLCRQSKPIRQILKRRTRGGRQSRLVCPWVAQEACDRSQARYMRFLIT